MRNASASRFRESVDGSQRGPRELRKKIQAVPQAVPFVRPRRQFPGRSALPSAGGDAGTGFSGADVVAARGGVVAGDDRRYVEGERPQAIHAASLPQTVTTASGTRATISVVTGDCAAGQANRCPTGDINAAAEAVAPRAAGAAIAAYRQVLVQRAARITDSPCQSGHPGTPTVTAVGTTSTDAADG